MPALWLPQVSVFSNLRPSHPTRPTRTMPSTGRWVSTHDTPLDERLASQLILLGADGHPPPDGHPPHPALTSSHMCPRCACRMRLPDALAVRRDETRLLVQVYQAYAKMVGMGVDEAATALQKKYVNDKYYGFNPVIKRTVADVTEVSSLRKLRVAKGIVSLGACGSARDAARVRGCACDALRAMTR